ncbi:RidA family protein [Bradyrhizobium canariense]|uniref:Enamine deaminase RidA, house cleaning of reactive enamine intermediates, YjgF/YER057c/UK114 family n=1 Tax=Bradyrhizobium canariense TaxID=255045 RepID=A0A1H1XN52_9BRAD|nr:RidA family protein [Bradyrhizobium canariense]SDT10707.1 Enamine deaminase RidA, house cleaning of reactive enamine intermediates, YjgF/YER057c/UK114 family [Bradyrhizobium canariense]
MTVHTAPSIANSSGTEARVHGFLYPESGPSAAWRVSSKEGEGSRFGRLMWIAGQYDGDGHGGIQNPGRVAVQVDAAMAKIGRAVETLGGRAADVVKLLVFHTVSDADGEDELLRRIRSCVRSDVPPVISLVALPRLWLPDMAVLIKAVAIDNADGKAPRRPGHPTGHWAWPRGGEFSHGLRCGEFVFVGAQSAKDGRGAIVHDGGIVSQAKLTISNISEVLDTLGCDLDDVVKLNTWYLGQGTDADWRRAAEVRSNAFRFPGPGATGVPVPRAYPDGAMIRQECIALRGADGRLPRALSWPLGHWDWPIRVSFQQGIKVGRLIVLGGQYSMNEKGLVVDDGNMSLQTDNTMEFIRRILDGFGARMQDLVEVTGFYKFSASNGTPLAGRKFSPQMPPVTEVPLGTMGLEGVTLEVEGFAIAPE